MSNVQSLRIIFWKYEDVLNRGVSRLSAVICFCWKALSWIFDLAPKWSVIRQKGEFQNGSFKKTKHTKFSEKRTFHTPWYAHVHSYHLIRTHTFKINNKKNAWQMSSSAWFREGARSGILFFEHRKQCPEFRYNNTDCVHLWVKWKFKSICESILLILNTLHSLLYYSQRISSHLRRNP